MNSFEMIIPSDEPLNKFQSIVKPMMDKISNNEFEIQSLTKTRDILLPKLMSGQVRVKGSIAMKIEKGIKNKRSPEAAKV